MDALRALGNLLVMAVVSAGAGIFWIAYHEDNTTSFGTVWFVSFLVVWALVAAMNGGKSRRH